MCWWIYVYQRLYIKDRQHISTPPPLSIQNRSWNISDMNSLPSCAIRTRVCAVGIGDIERPGPYMSWTNHMSVSAVNHILASINSLKPSWLNEHLKVQCVEINGHLVVKLLVAAEHPSPPPPPPPSPSKQRGDPVAAFSCHKNSEGV